MAHAAEKLTLGLIGALSRFLFSLQPFYQLPRVVQQTLADLRGQKHLFRAIEGREIREPVSGRIPIFIDVGQMSQKKEKFILFAQHNPLQSQQGV